MKRATGRAQTGFALFFFVYTLRQRPNRKFESNFEERKKRKTYIISNRQVATLHVNLVHTTGWWEVIAWSSVATAASVWIIIVGIR